MSVTYELRMPNGHPVGRIRDVRPVYEPVREPEEDGAYGPDGGVYDEWVEGLSGARVRWPAALAREVDG